jgi:uncharacterized repeat protein (TIGR03843 family)
VNGWTPENGLPLDGLRPFLETGELTIEGRMPWSSNATFLVTVEAPGDDELQAIYKPAGGEQDLWDFPGGLYRREVAASVLSDTLGWDLVPPTVERREGPFGEGSLQLFVKADYEEHYFTLFDEERDEDTEESRALGRALRAMCVFDLVANNADRKSGHVLRGSDGHIWGIDHGLCFHHLPKVRTVLWDFAGEEIPELLMEDLKARREAVGEALLPYLDVDELVMLDARIDHLVDHPWFPEPRGDRPPYPWPLV